MDQETETYSAGTSFDTFLNDTFSGANAVSEHFPESPTESASNDAAGAPPAEPSTDSGPNSTSPEGAQTTSTETPADGTPPEPSSAAPIDDPLKDAVPFTYSVNGQQRTFDGIRVIPNVGAIVDQTALEHLTRRFTERDNLYERSQQQHDQVQALNRLMTWTQQGSDGKPVELTGPQALEAQRVLLGRTLAALDTLSSALNDPAMLASLVYVDENQKLALNQSALEHLTTRATLAEVHAEQQVRQQWASLNAPQPPAAPNVEQVAPNVVASYAAELGKDATGKSVLTGDDLKFLTAQVPRYLRPPTAEDIRANPALQQERLVVDPLFAQLVQDRVAIRKDLATKVGQASAIADENSKKLQAALLPNGKAPAQTTNTQRPPMRTQAQPSPTENDRHALFLSMEQAAARAI